MPPDPLVGAYQVCFTYYAKLNTLLTPIFNVATMANDQPWNPSRLIYFADIM